MNLESNERELATFTIVRLVDYTDYDFNINPGNVHCQIVDYKEVLCYYHDTGEPVLDQNGNHVFNIFKTVITEKTIPLTWEVANQWGADDQIIFDYIIEQLNNES